MKHLFLSLLLIPAVLAAGDPPAAAGDAPAAVPEPVPETQGGGGRDGSSGEARSAEVRDFERRMREEVTRFGFEDPVAVMPDQPALPQEWERHLEYSDSPDGKGAGPYGRFFGRYPDFLAVEVVEGRPPEAVHEGRRALRMSLAGSRGMDLVAVKRRIPLDVNPDFAYELTGWIRLQDVSRPDSWARLGIEWLDARGRRIGAIRWSDKVDLAYLKKQEIPAGQAWVPAPELRVNDVGRDVAAARVWCEASGRDPGAWAVFDDIELGRRPKVRVEFVSPGQVGIFSAGQVPELQLSFTGLKPVRPAASSGVSGLVNRMLGGLQSSMAVEVPVSYRRSVAVQDLFGRAIRVPDREFGAADIRGGTIVEPLRLAELSRPGAYALRVSLAAVGPDGARVEVAGRVLRLVKLGADSGPGGYGTEAELHGPDARRLLAAIDLLAAPVAVRLGSENQAEPAGRAAPTGAAAGASAGEASPQEILARRLRGLADRKLQVEGILCSAGDAAAFYSSDGWERSLEADVIDFRTLVSSWWLAPAAEGGFGRGLFKGRTELAEKVRSGVLSKAAGKVIEVPVHLDALEAPAPDISGELYRETVFVPAAATREQLADRLAALFPAGAAGGAGRGRDWFLELPEASENLSLNMEDERRQVRDLARKATALAVAGAGRCFAGLSDPKRGLLGPDLNPRPAYAAWHVLGRYLAGAECLGPFDLDKAANTSAWAFRRRVEGSEEGFVVFWTDGPEREIPAQLGTCGRASLVEITGASQKLRLPRSSAEAGGLREAEMVPLSNVPALLTGLEPALIQTRLGFRLAEGARLECRYEPQTVCFEVPNYFPSDMTATVYPRFLQGSSVDPRFRLVNIKAGRSERIEFDIRPSFIETVGAKDIAIDLDLAVKNRRESFTLTRKLTVESMLTLEHIESYDDDGRTAHVQLSAGVKAGIKPARNFTDLEVSMVVPGLGRQRAVLTDVPTGDSRQMGVPFTVILGSKPQTVYAGVRERNGNWFANVEISLPAASPSRSRR